MGAKASAYAAAGVDIDRKMAALRRAKRAIEATFTRGAVGRLGTFGGMFRSPGRDTLLVASTDGVGTKLKVAVMSGRHNTVGEDIVNHCVNDILVQGAEPLFFLDYIGASRLDPAVLAQLIEGLCRACRQNGCALIGGETAEMPGLYPEGEYDLVGTIVGAVRRRDVITGREIRAGDVLIGLPSSGLHTNGYTLARQIIFERARLTLDDLVPGDGRTVADALLAVHRSYLRPIRALRRAVAVRGLRLASLWEYSPKLRVEGRLEWRDAEYRGDPGFGARAAARREDKGVLAALAGNWQIGPRTRGVATLMREHRGSSAAGLDFDYWTLSGSLQWVF